MIFNTTNIVIFFPNQRLCIVTIIFFDFFAEKFGISKKVRTFATEINKTLSKIQ